MKTFFLILVLLTAEIPIFSLVKSLSIFDFLFTVYLIFFLYKYKINGYDYFLILTFITIIVVANNISLMFNNFYPINIDNLIQSIIYIFRLIEMFLFLWLIYYLGKKNLVYLKKAVYYSLIIAFLLSMFYTCLVFFNVIIDERAISIQYRFSSFFGNANGYGYFLLYVFVANYFYTKSVLYKSTLSFLIIFNIILTGSFSTYILLVLILLMQIRLQNIIKIIFFGIISIVILDSLYMYYSEFLPNRIQNIIELGTVSHIGTYSTRSEHIEMALSYIVDNMAYFLWFGLGLGNSNIFIDNDSFVAPHNVIVNMLLMIGIIPTLLLVAIFIFIFSRLLSNSNNKRNYYSFLLVFIGNSIFSPIVYLPQLYIPLILILNKSKNLENKK